MFGMSVEWAVAMSSAAGNEKPGTGFPPSPISKLLCLHRRLRCELRIKRARLPTVADLEAPMPASTAEYELRKEARTVPASTAEM